MSASLKILLFVSSCFFLIAACDSDQRITTDEEPPELAQARALADEFISRLKPQLKQALTEGGPGDAIAVCSSVAPKLATALSNESGWRVRRVSLQARNASRAIPDGWESAVLRQFDERAAAGEKPATLYFGEQVGGHFRYLQAQGVDGVCLTCHGEQLSQPVINALAQYYPDDSATGYRQGQVRGAISLSRQLR